MTRIAIIGAGISGLATAFAVERQAAIAGFDVETVVLEKETHNGGKIRSFQEDGYLCEWGPNGFLDNKPMTLELCRQLAIDNRLLRSDDNARKRFIYSGGMLHRLPENGLSFLRSQLISWPGKLRLAAELLVPRRTQDGDETLAEFGRRRLGREALDKLIAPMVSGIFAGDPETMSLKSCFPRIYELEQAYGGLLKAMIRLARKKRADIKAGKAVASAAGPGGTLTSFGGGIQELPEALAAQLQGQIRHGSGVCALRQQEGGFVLQLEDGDTVEADLVVSALPAYAAAALLDELAADAAQVLRGIPYAAMNVVCLGYDKRQISHDLDGFGYLIPKAEGCHILGTLWDSSIFTQRAPAGKVLLRSMMGGATNPAAVKLSDDEVIARTRADLQQIMGIASEPEFIRIFRHPRAIPQYTRGHAQRLRQLDDALQKLPDLFMTGNALAGVSLNDCINAANTIADQVIARIQTRA